MRPERLVGEAVVLRPLRDDDVPAIADPGTDAYLGAMDMRLHPDRSGEVGYHVVPWSRGRGVGRRMAAAVGFVVEGTCRQRLVHRGRRVDGWIGSLLPGELR